MDLQKIDNLVPCQLCKLIFDFTKVCKHFSQQKEHEIQHDQLKELLQNSAQDKKMQALSKIAQSLDILSTCRVTSFTLTKH